MQHAISIPEMTKQIGPQLEVMARAIETCVHCGFCLPVCPTYQVLGEEMDSPRGRIVLMKAVLEGELTAQDTKAYIDRCLGCLGCVTACPSGVQYGDLVMPYRAYAQKLISRPLMNKVQHTLVHQTLPYPGRFRSAASLGKLARPIGGVMPKEMQGMLSLLPDKLPEAKPMPEFVPAEGTRRARVALLAGCVQQVLEPEINWATLRVLAKNGVEVVIPRGQVCCGALPQHTGEKEQALQFARQNLRVFPHDVDAIITNAAGCGSGMKEYKIIFKGLDEEELVEEFVSKVQDVSQFLASLGLVNTPALPQPLKAAYHDACHLAHAQGITEPPRRLLSQVGNLSILEIPDGAICCGSAGTYNLEQPEIAAELGKRKAQNILNTSAEAVVLGNIGCMVQIQNHLQHLGKPMPVYHTMEILDLAYRNGNISK